MKKKVIIPICLFAVPIIVLVLAKWYQSTQDTNYIPHPNVINLYYNGEQKQITKNSGIKDGNGEDIYKTICELVIFRMPDELNVDNSSFLSETSDEIMEAKKDAVGFLYHKPKRITLNHGNVDQIQYTEILIIINGKYKDNVYIKTKDNSYIFVGVMNNLSYINKNIF